MNNEGAAESRKAFLQSTNSLLITHHSLQICQKQF